MLVLGKGKVSLKLNVRKKYSLQDVLHTPYIHRNLIFANLLNRLELELLLILENLYSPRVATLWERVFVVGRGFVLNLVVENQMNASIAYITESTSLWHTRLGHVNIASIKRL